MHQEVVYTLLAFVFVFPFIISEWNVVILVFRVKVTGQLSGLASVGVTTHKTGNEISFKIVATCNTYLKYTLFERILPSFAI